MDFDNLAHLPLDQQQLVRTVTNRLHSEYAGTFGPETIQRFVVDSLQLLLPTAKVTSFLPVLVEKFARDQLRALGKLDGSLPSAVPSVLFLCVHNAGRSQMAAGWLRHLAGDRATVRCGTRWPSAVCCAASTRWERSRPRGGSRRVTGSSSHCATRSSSSRVISGADR